MTWIKSLKTARTLVVLGFILALVSIGATFSHIGNVDFVFIGTGMTGGTHAWHHLLREAFGDLGTFAGIFMLLFCAAKYRTSLSWWVMVVLALGFFAPYWIGVPFNPELAAPPQAEPGHIAQAVLVFAGLLAARRHYLTSPIRESANPEMRR